MSSPNSNGWTAVPVDAGSIFEKGFRRPAPLPANEIKFPNDDPIVSKTFKYAQAVLHPETMNHSMRVYYFGTSLNPRRNILTVGKEWPSCNNSQPNPSP